MTAEYSGSASAIPPAYVHAFDTAEMKRLAEGLASAGWTVVEDPALSEILADRRTWVHNRDGFQTVLQVWDMINNIGVELRHEGSEDAQTLFRSEWISVNRLVALLDVMGIVRASDEWTRWWRSTVWR